MKTKTKHTPGQCGSCLSLDRSPEPMTLNGLRFACGYQHTIIVHESDFRVYAAAPDLLALIVELHEFFGCAIADGSKTCKMCDVIAKAEQ